MLGCILANWNGIRRSVADPGARRLVPSLPGLSPLLPEPTPTDASVHPTCRCVTLSGPSHRAASNPIVRTHPYTARKCLYVMRDDCVGIDGIGAEALIAAW